MSSIITQGFGTAVLLTQGLAASVYGTGGMSQAGSSLAVAPAVIGRDSFTDTAGTVLETHVPDAGGAWVSNSATSGNQAVIDSANRVRNRSTALVAYSLSDAPASANQSVQADLVYLSQNSGSSSADVTARFSVTSVTGYSAGYDSASQVWHISRWNGGTQTVLQTAPDVLAGGSSYTENLVVRDSSLSLYVNGGLIIGPLTDSTPINDTGNVGILFRTSGAIGDTDTTGAHLDNFLAQGTDESTDIVAQYVPSATGGIGHGGVARYALDAQFGATGGIALGSDELIVGDMLVTPSGGASAAGCALISGEMSIAGTGGLVQGGISWLDEASQDATSGGFSAGGVGSTTWAVALTAGPLMTHGGAALSERSQIAMSPVAFGLGTGLIVTQGYASRVPNTYAMSGTGGMAQGGVVSASAVFQEGADGGVLQGGSFVGVPTTYFVYMNTGNGEPIDYTTPVASLTALNWTSGALVIAGDYKLAVRAFDRLSGLEEQNVDAVVEVVLDESGNDVTRVPLPPLGPRAVALAGGIIRVEWAYSSTDPSRQPVGFHLYLGSDSRPDYFTPVATVNWADQRQGSFSTELGGLKGGTSYSIGVRGFNAIGEEANTLVLSITADADPPSVVDGLQAEVTNANA